MPGTITEVKSTWTVAEQFVEERIKLKQSNSRIALALRNAKIHRPALYVAAKKSFERALEQEEINTVNGNPGKNVAKTKTNIADCKHVQERFPQIESNSRMIAPQKRSCTDSVIKTLGSRTDSTKLTGSFQIALNTKSESPLGKSCNATKRGKSDKTVALKTVNVKPWENDDIKSASIAGPIQGDVERERRIDRNIFRLMELLQECNERRHNDIRSYSSGRQYGCGTRSYQDDSDSIQHTNQKLLKPGSIVSPEGTFPGSEGVENGCLSGVLMIRSKVKPPNPWCFHQLPPMDKPVQQNIKRNANLERTCSIYKMPELKKDCHICSECRQAAEKMSRDHGNEVESEQLKRLKRRLKLKERAYLEKEPSIICKRAPTLRFVQGEKNSSELEHQTDAKLGENLSFPKLYLSHHSINADNHREARKMKTNTIDSIRTLDMFSNAKKQLCYRLEKMEQMNGTNSCHDKSNVNKKSAKQTKPKECSAFSAKKCERSQGHARILVTPLRGFTPHWNDFPESPMFWRENTEVREEEITSEDTEQVKVEKE